MKNLIVLLLILFPTLLFAQDSYKIEYDKAEKLYEAQKLKPAYDEFKKLVARIPKSDTLYEYTLWYYVGVTTQLEKKHRMAEEFKESLKYGMEALELINEGKEVFNNTFAKREHFMTKNIIVSHFGLGNFEEGKKWKNEKMYHAQKKGTLPKGIDEYFNFDYFTLDGKNVWGYEWFEELPKDRFSKSFSKIVYYVYSTNADGTDKDQLYRLHVLMFHGTDVKFDYVMDKRRAESKKEICGTLYSYTYQEDINYKKLQNDVKQIIKGNLKPDTKRTTTKDKNGKTIIDIVK